MIFDVHSLSGDVHMSASSEEARTQSSVTLAVFPPFTLHPTQTPFDDCRAMIVRVYPRAGVQRMSAERRTQIERRDELVSRSPYRFFHPCQTALAGPLFDSFVERFGLERGWAVGIVMAKEDVVAATSGAIEHLLRRAIPRYFGQVPFVPKFNGPAPFQEKGLNVEAIVDRLWNPYPTAKAAAKPT